MMKRYALLVALVVFGLSAVLAITRGVYPVMVVDGMMVSERTVREKYYGALEYYRIALTTYTTAPPQFGAAERRELKRAVLEGLIEETLIHGELARREPKELARIVESKIAKALENPEFTAAARALYGLDLGAAKRFILVPQAEREILEGRLFLEERELGEWLEDAKRSARVTLLIPGFSWNNGIVVAE